MTNTASEALARLRALNEARTSGKWQATGLVVFPDVAMSNPIAVCQRALGDDWMHAAENAAAIVAALNALGPLLDASAALDALVQSLAENDEDGLTEFADEMTQARAALDAIAKLEGK